MSDNIKIIKFYAPWCGPCKVYGRTFTKVVNKLGLEATEINIDQQPDIAAQYNVTNIPHTVILKDGEIVSERTGAMIQRDLTAMIQEAY